MGAAPASPPDAPVTFTNVHELEAALDRGAMVGARSTPLRSVESRANEIRKTGLVVFC